MRRTISIILASLIIILLFPLASLGQELGLIIDDAYLLTDGEIQDLTIRAEDISQRYETDVSIILVDDMDSWDAFDYADALREELDLGYGQDKSLILLFLSMADRDYALLAHGYGNTAFTDHGKDVMLDKHILPLLGKDKYFEAFTSYLDLAEEYLDLARSGNPFDIDSDPDHGKVPIAIKLGITILIPIIIAGLICARWKRQMKTAILARTATNYISDQGLTLTRKRDHLLYRTQSRRNIEKSSSSGGGGGGTTVRSSGSSGRSGKF